MSDLRPLTMSDIELCLFCWMAVRGDHRCGNPTECECSIDHSKQTVVLSLTEKDSE